MSSSISRRQFIETGILCTGILLSGCTQNQSRSIQITILNYTTDKHNAKISLSTEGSEDIVQNIDVSKGDSNDPSTTETTIRKSPFSKGESVQVKAILDGVAKKTSYKMKCGGETNGDDIILRISDNISFSKSCIK